MIDLRSDTFTLPTQGMRNAIANAVVGDDVFGEDPTVNELQDYVADMLGKESALFVTSGSLGNQLAIAVSTNPGDEIIVEADSHIFKYETAAPAIISRVQTNCISSPDGMMNPDEVRKAIRTKDFYMPVTSLVCVENTHNRHGGTILEPDNIESIYKICKENSLRFHCDGARLWHACVERDILPADYVKYFDTVSVCFSKGLGAPVGSALVGSKEDIEKARKWRKILGGGMRQAGIIAAGASYALKENLQLLKHDHEKAKTFARLVSESEFVKVNMGNVQTNMVAFKIDDRFDANLFSQNCKDKGLLVLPTGNNKIRAVFHFQIEDEKAVLAVEIVKDVLNKMK